MLKSTAQFVSLVKLTPLFRPRLVPALTKVMKYNFSNQQSGGDKQGQHQHSQNCSHNHKQQPQPKPEAHQHGPNCSHHNPNDIWPKEADSIDYSKLTFEQLIELNSHESLIYTRPHLDKAQTKLKQLKDQKEQLLKSLEFYKKLELEHSQKQQTLTAHIKAYQEEAELSKRRAEKQIEDSKQFAVTKIAKELLQVADCVANCRKFAETDSKGDKFLQMVVQSHRVIKEMLKKFNIEQFDPTGQEYDPNQQESLMNIPTPPNFKPNHVAMTMRTGYTINGRLLRSARVGIFS